MSPQSKKRHSRSKHSKPKKLVSFKEYKKQTEEVKPTSLKQRILLDILAVIIVLVIGSIVFIAIGQYRAKHAGAKDKDQLIQNYIAAMNDVDRNDIKQCYYPYQPDMQSYETDIDRQIQYAQNAKDQEQITWDPTGIKTEWTSADTATITEVLPNAQPEEAQLGVSFIPLTQKSGDYTIHQEDVYQFIVFRTGDTWYLAAYMQAARNLTTVEDANGNQLSEEEINKWLYSMSYEIGNDNVGYLYVDKSWVEIADPENPDEYIKTFITSDYSSYMTMASIADADVEDFKAYSTSIIQQSERNYGDIIESEGVIGTYHTDVQISQNKETGARIIVWIFKTDENDTRTHVITLEALSDYDASTYINTFHTVKTQMDNSSETQPTAESE